MTTFEIKCIEKSDSNQIHEIARKIGGTNFDGSFWEVTVEKAINAIEFGEWKFYIQDGSNKAEVIIATTTSGEKYLKTKTDTGNENKLLLLPEFNK